jgi:sugar phosphate isomerase/epimerase
LNLDIGNVFIANQEPLDFVERFHRKISHVHVKDVSESLALESRGDLTGIASSHCAVGEGVNAQNVRRCIERLTALGYDGVLTIECEAQGGIIERSVTWMRQLIAQTMKPRARSFY